jgi:hypothetical protein
MASPLPKVRPLENKEIEHHRGVLYMAPLLDCGTAFPKPNTCADCQSAEHVVITDSRNKGSAFNQTAAAWRQILYRAGIPQRPLSFNGIKAAKEA